jgi:transcriptional regulator with XRE-family HTH domain
LLGQQTCLLGQQPPEGSPSEASTWQYVVVDHNTGDRGNAPSLGARIRELRLAAHLSQRALASRVGVSFPHISKVEAGREPASADLLERIAEAVGANPDELLLLADRLPDELREAVAAKPDLAPRFLRRWREGHISDDEVRRLIGDEDQG